MEETLLELIELAKSAAPELWEIALRQVYTNLTVQILLTIICFGIVVFSGIWFKKFLNKREAYIQNEINQGYRVSFLDDSRYSEELTWLAVLFCSFSVGVIVGISTIILRFMNPQYYAIRILLNLVR